MSKILEKVVFAFIIIIKIFIFIITIYFNVEKQFFL